MVTLGRHTRPNVIQRHVDVALSQSDYWLLFHIPFRNFCLKALVLFKVLPFEWNAHSTPFNPWIETVFVCGWPKTEPSFANLQHRQIVGLTESSSVWGTRRNHRGPNQGCKEDDQALQWTVCRSYRGIHVSSAVTVLLRKSTPSCWNRWTKRRHDSILWVFWHSDSILGINLAHIYNLLIFKLSWIIVCTVPTLQSTRWLSSLTVIRLSLSRTCLISWTFYDVIDVGRPLHCSSITLSYPFSYREYHLCNAVLFIVASPYALTNISKFSFLFLSIENTEVNRCSLFDTHLDAPCINKIALPLKWRHTLMWHHWRRVKIWRHTVLKFGDDIG